LTEHQKETLKRKREDIPALYNDLSQSSSQNSQNLQQWFDIKAKHINEIDQVSNKKIDPVMQKSIDNDANKENKVTTEQVEFSNVTDKTVDNIFSNELDGNIEENTVDTNTKQNENSTKKLKKDEESNEKQDTSKQTNLSPSVSISGENITSKADEQADVEMTIASVVKKLDFESRDEFPEDKIHEQQSSPSMLDSIKRRHRSSLTKLTSLKDDETIEIQKDPSTTNVQRTLRMKTTQGKSGTNSKQKSDDDTDIKENVNENKKSIKRKYVSDTESDGSVQRRKRKLIASTKSLNDDGGETSRSSDNVFPDIDMDNVSQRVKNEISRLKINMVFDCPAVNRRRIKHSDEGEKETIIHGLRKYGTPDKSFKLKSMDIKSAEGSKKSPKVQEKNVDDTDQGVLKRRSRRSKQESKNDLDTKDINKNPNTTNVNKDINKDVKDVKDLKDIKDVNKDKDVKKSNDTIEEIFELKNADSDMIHIIPTFNQTVQDINKAQDEGFEDNLKSNSDIRLVELTEATEQSQDVEVEDVIESSQAPNIGLKLDKICGEKQCFIKINKMTNIHAAKTSDAIIDKNYVPESIPMDCDDNNVPDPYEELDEANPDSTETKDEENIDSIDKDSIQKTDNSNTKNSISEGQKTIDNSLSIKSTSVIIFSSPRSNSKIFSKPKPFTGRAAHMLGLVTNQARLENDNSPIVIEEDSSIKKLKTKDAENEVSTNKKILIVKEIDKIGGPSGSRQEKIFSNMRSTDSASSSTHTFTTLKNDGEKLSFKLNKSASDCLSIESSTDKENERNASPLREKEDLPILEWSSANPPSLTASPSASILKRHRSSLSEPDLDISTPRVFSNLYYYMSCFLKNKIKLKI